MTGSQLTDPRPGCAIELRGVRKRFADREVLRGIDLRLPAGEIVGLLGCNGAGKTTLIRIMTGLLAADQGSVQVAGIDVRRSVEGLGALIGLAPQELGLYPQLSARQNLRCFGEIAGLRPSAARSRADELLGLFGLEACAGQATVRLSGGQRRRLHTAIALVHNPSVLFLDEPTVGADVAARREILKVVRDLAGQGTTVVYTTHYLPELEQLDARIVVLHDGRIAADAPLGELIDSFAKPGVRLRFSGGAPEVPGWRRQGDVLAPEFPVTNAGLALASVLSSPQVTGADLSDVTVRRADLESAFLAITGEELAAGESGDVD